MKISTISQSSYESCQNFTGLKISKSAYSTIDRLPAEYLERLFAAKKELDRIKTFDVLLNSNMIFSIVKNTENAPNQEKQPFLRKLVKSLFQNMRKPQLDYMNNTEIEMKYSGQPYKIDFQGETYYGRWPDIPDTLTTLWDSLGIKNHKREYIKFKQLDKLDQASYLAKKLDKVETEKDKYIQAL